MFEVLLLLFITFFVFNYMLENNIYNPLSLFLLIMTTITILSNTIESSETFDDAYLLILVGTISFYIGYTVMRFSRKDISIGRREYCFSHEIREKPLRIVTIIVLLFYIFLAVRVTLSIIIGGYSYNAIRMLVAQGDENLKISIIYGSNLIKTLDLMIFRSLFYVIVVLAIIRCFKYKHIDTQIVLSMLLVVCYTMVDFSRLVLLVIAVQITVCMFVSRKLNQEELYQIKRFIKRYIIPAIVILIVALRIVSSLRVSSSNNSNEDFSIYFSIPVPLLSYYKTLIDSNGDHTYGVMFFKGLWNFVMTFIGRMGIKFPLYDQATSIVNETQTFLTLQNGTKANAYTTLFYYFYTDFGYFGVIFGCVFFGGFLGYLYRKIINSIKVDELRLAMYLLLMQALTKSFIRWEFVIMSYAMSFVWMTLFFKRMYEEDI